MLANIRYDIMRVMSKSWLNNPQFNQTQSRGTSCS
nr:MAG TPA: hypothetical protein [Caudoviricetes sp.]